MGTATAKRIKWNSTREDMDLILKIIDRAATITKELGRELPDGLAMDITACHLNGRPLDLSRLLAADDFNFVHDVWGIHRHIDRTTGELGDCFLPRFSAR